MIVTVTLNPSVDRTYEVAALAVGEVNRAARVHQEPSGKGVNVTRALTVNRVPSLAVLPCGGPEGDTLIALLEAEQVVYRAVPISGSVRVNISVAEPGGRATKINEAGASLDRAELERLTSAALAATGPGDWLAASGSLPPGVPPDYYAHLGRRAHEAGLRFALDTSGAALRAGLAAGPDVVKPNVDELAEVTGTQIRSPGAAIAAARELLARGAGCVVVSMGADGALLVSPDGTWHASAGAPRVRSTVGAGDALLAGFLAGGGTGEGALREAVLWATAAVGAPGSHVPLIDDAVRGAIHVRIRQQAGLSHPRPAPDTRRPERENRLMVAPSLNEKNLALIIDETLHRHPTGGLATGVVGPGGLEFFRGSGVADAARGTPVTEDTVFRAGSISKTFTAIAVMQLRDRGLIELDDPVRRHLRSFRLIPARASFGPVTIRHLLTHTGGIGEVRGLGDLFRPTIGLAIPAGEPAPALADYYRGRLRIEVEPGSKWAYANHGFAVLGQLVEDVSGEPFGAYMRGHVFGPLGMQHTDFERTGPIADQLATGYMLRRHGLKAVKDRDIVVQAAGSLFTTTADMARYAAALLGGGGLPLETATLSEMFQPHYQPDPRIPALGLSFWLGHVDGHRTIGHGGAWPGFISVMTVAPDDGVAVLAFTNTGTVTPERVSDALLREVLGVGPDEPRGDVPEHPDVWGELCGWYGPDPGPNTNARTRMLLGGGAEVIVRHDYLTLRAFTPAPRLRRGYRLHADDRADPYRFRLDVTAEGLGTWPVAFSRGGDGRMTLYLGPAPMSLARRPAYRNPGRLAVAGAGAAIVAVAVTARRALRRPG
jgi:1-phosphofructokinase family hexose kinase